MIWRMGAVFLLAFGMALVNAKPAEAALQVWICNDALCAGEVAVTDNLAGDVNPVLGAITVITGAGSVELATSYPFTGSPANPFLNLTYSFGATDFGILGTPYVFASQTGFTGVGSARLEANASNGGGITTAYAGAGAFTPPTGTAIIGPLPMDFVASGSVPAAPYYLALGIQVTAGVGGAASGDATITVPEPASMTLFGLGLLGAGFTARRRRRQAI